MEKEIHIPLNRSVAFNKAISDVTAQFSALLLSCKVHVIYFLHNSLPLETFFSSLFAHLGLHQVTFKSAIVQGERTLSFLSAILDP